MKKIKMDDNVWTPELMGLKRVKKVQGKLELTVICFACGKEIELAAGKPMKLFVLPSKEFVVGICSRECGEKVRLMIKGSGDPEKMYG